MGADTADSGPIQIMYKSFQYCVRVLLLDKWNNPICNDTVTEEDSIKYDIFEMVWLSS